MQREPELVPVGAALIREGTELRRLAEALRPRFDLSVEALTEMCGAVVVDLRALGQLAGYEPGDVYGYWHAPSRGYAVRVVPRGGSRMLPSEPGGVRDVFAYEIAVDLHTDLGVPLELAQRFVDAFVDETTQNPLEVVGLRCGLDLTLLPVDQP